MNKEQLELKVKELTAALTQFETDQTALAQQLKEAKVQLADVNKIKITRDTVNDIRQAIEDVFGNSSFNDVDSYDVDFEIDYNNSLALSNIEFNDVDNVAEEISDAIEGLFNIISNEDED
tara:strand:+ start:79 stop:438 length:360 start_codon:yes stop_codon:yes gene_type:complete